MEEMSREKVIKGLECHFLVEMNVCEKCPYYPMRNCSDDMAKDALVLLKAQEPKLVHVTADINHRKIGECPTCGKWINSGDYPNYCGHCGQAVRWK